MKVVHTNKKINCASKCQVSVDNYIESSNRFVALLISDMDIKLRTSADVVDLMLCRDVLTRHIIETYGTLSPEDKKIVDEVTQELGVKKHE